MTAHISGLDRLAIASYFLRKTAGADASDVDGEWRARHVLLGKLNVDGVCAGLRWFVGNAAASIFVIVTFDVRLARAFNRKAESTVT